LTKDDLIHFIARVQAENRIQIPTEVRQYLKLESGKSLRIRIATISNFSFCEEFIAKLASDGRITVPWEIRWKLEIQPGNMVHMYIFHPKLK